MINRQKMRKLLSTFRKKEKKIRKIYENNIQYTYISEEFRNIHTEEEDNIRSKYQIIKDKEIIILIKRR